VSALIEPQKIVVAEEMQERVERVRVRQVENKEQVERKREMVAEKLSERRKGVVTGIANRVVVRLEARLVRLLRFETVIQKRIDRREADGKDVTEVVNKMTEVVFYKDSFKSALGEIQTKLDVLLASENPREMYVELREAVSDARLALVEMRKALVNVVRVLVQT